LAFVSLVTSAEHVDARIEAFLKKFSNMLENMEKKELEEVRSSLIRLKQLSDVHLKEEVSRNWGEITSGYYLFDRLERQASDLGVEPKAMLV
jgi:nardilysin